SKNRLECRSRRAHQTMSKPQSFRIKRFVVPVTVMLTFISFWRAAAILLADLGSSAYYVGGITEKAIENQRPGSSSESYCFRMPYGRCISRAAACLFGVA